MILEKKLYSKNEIENILHVKSRKQVVNKLKNYNVSYTISGRGNYSVTVENISVFDNFRLFCVFELELSPLSDFMLFAEFVYYILCDEYFVMLPDTLKEEYMSADGNYISRQTISKYTNKLELANLIHRSEGDVRFYFAYQHSTIETDKETYCKAWREYFDIRDSSGSSIPAVAHVINKYGGMPQKHYIPIQNIINIDIINNLIDNVTQIVIETHS